MKLEHGQIRLGVRRTTRITPRHSVLHQISYCLGLVQHLSRPRPPRTARTGHGLRERQPQPT